MITQTMAGCVRAVYFVMCLWFSFGQVSTGCQEGWFGSSCQYKCHCATDRCHINGSCLENDKCQTGWFGANCQFQDLAVNGSVLLVPQGKSDLLQDNNDDTCHHNVNALLLTWKRNYVFSWLRIKMNETGLAFSVMFKPLNTGDTTLKNNEYINCTNQKIYYNGNQTYYVHCNTSDSIHEIFLVWQGPRTVCSLNVNAGRNVALKQVAELSSNLDEKSVAGHAVDGNTESFYHSGSCVHTKEGDPNPRLLVKFAVPAIVDRIVIYNRIDCCQDRLKGFHLQTWTATGAADIDYTDSILYPQNVYNVVAPKNRKVITQISLTSQDKKNGLFLSICELQVYGDSFCPPKLFGAECQFHCNCADVNESCDVSTGLCLSGCARGFSGEGCVSCQQGFYGANCSRECSSGCSNHHCHVNTGKCYSCLSGYQGDFCNQTCSIGTFGENCQQNCPDTCQLTCNSTTGFCTSCSPGYRGNNCTEFCQPGYFGANCSRTCPGGCKDPNCHHVTGHCTPCQVMHKGNFCENCIDGYYGERCAASCPRNCKNSRCQIYTGQCDICTAGYYGDFCNQTCQTGYFGENCAKACPSGCQNSSCDAVSGQCTSCKPGYRGPSCDSSCQSGYFGENCAKACPSGCQNSSCDAVRGQCTSCKPGYRGPSCDSYCEVGRYGESCLQTCPTSCKNSSCSAITGHCGDCLEGFQGEFCQFCVVGRYGPTCNEECPVNCKHSKCNATTGECYSCSTGYLGRFCNNTCPNGTYGEMCLWICSSQCRHCNHSTGYCLKCQSGFSGHFCEKQINTLFTAASLGLAKEDSVFAANIFIYTTVAFIMTTILLLFLVIRRSRKWTPESHHDVTVETTKITSHGNHEKIKADPGQMLTTLT